MPLNVFLDKCNESGAVLLFFMVTDAGNVAELFHRRGFDGGQRVEHFVAEDNVWREPLFIGAVKTESPEGFEEFGIFEACRRWESGNGDGGNLKAQLRLLLRLFMGAMVDDTELGTFPAIEDIVADIRYNYLICIIIRYFDKSHL